MINLAGDKKCDTIIREELQIANIPIIELGSYMNSEVSASVIGLLNGFKFKRAWYYWMVDGYMPLKYADYLYDNYEDLNIRVAGHCGNPPPKEWITCKNKSKLLDPLFELYESGKITMDEFNIQAKELTNAEEPFISSYHIDSQLGLCKFAETIIKNNIMG